MKTGRTVLIACVLLSMAVMLAGCGKKSRDNNQLLKEAQNGNVDAQYLVGMAYLNGQFGETVDNDAAAWIQKAAEQGHKEAQNQMGIMCQNGMAVNKNEKTAFEWYKKSAEQNYAPALCNMAMMLLESPAQTKKQAMELLAKAAAQGYADAQYQLGKLNFGYSDAYEYSIEAAKYFRQAAEQGHIESQYMLGTMTVAGKGTPKDEVEGLAWMYLGSIRMPSGEKNLLQQAEANVSEATRLKAQERAKVLQAQIEARLKRAQKSD